MIHMIQYRTNHNLDFNQLSYDERITCVYYKSNTTLHSIMKSSLLSVLVAAVFLFGVAAAAAVVDVEVTPGRPPRRTLVSKKTTNPEGSSSQEITSDFEQGDLGDLAEDAPQCTCPPGYCFQKMGFLCKYCVD